VVKVSPFGQFFMKINSNIRNIFYDSAASVWPGTGFLDLGSYVCMCS
jgi:hypothetical protein